jgi:AcrR family transcriptional regulator
MSTLSERARQGSKRRELQRLETVRAIEGAALRLFREQGYDATTTKQIAEAAGVAHGTVFLVAPSKEGLLVVVLEAKLREVATARMATLPKRGIAAQLAYLCAPLFDFFAENPALSRALLKGMMFFADPVAKARRDAHVGDFLRYLASLFVEAKHRGELAYRADPQICAANVFAIYIDAVTAFLTADKPDRRALGASFETRLDALLRGVVDRSHEKRK